MKLAMSLPYKKYICVICGFIYDEAEGWPEDGIEAGTRWEEVPEKRKVRHPRGQRRDAGREDV